MSLAQTLTCSRTAENKARQEQNNTEDVRDVTTKAPDAFDGQWAPPTSPSPSQTAWQCREKGHLCGSTDGAARQRNAFEAARSQTARTARTLRWRAEQVIRGLPSHQDALKAKKMNFIFMSHVLRTDLWWIWVWISKLQFLTLIWKEDFGLFHSNMLNMNQFSQALRLSEETFTG